MKYSEVKDGEIFFIDRSYTYPKIKIGLGHKDLRNEASNSHGNPDWEVEILENPALRSQLAEAEGVMKEQARMLENWQDHSGWCMFCDTECDDDFVITHDEDCKYGKIVKSHEAYKSAHPTEKG